MLTIQISAAQLASQRTVLLTEVDRRPPLTVERAAQMAEIAFAEGRYYDGERLIVIANSLAEERLGYHNYRAE